MAIEQELIRELLLEIVKSKPDIQTNDHKWLIGMLKDMYNPKREIQHSECLKEINGLASCLSWGFVDEIRDTYGVTIEASDAKTIFRKLVNNYGLQEDLSRWCIETWCIASNKIIRLDAIEVNSGSSNQLNATPISLSRYNYTEKLFLEIVLNTLNDKPFDLDTRFDLSVKGKQLKIKDEDIHSIIETSIHQLSDIKKKEIEKQRIESQRILDEKRQEQKKLEAEQRQLKEKLHHEAIKHISDGIKLIKTKNYNDAIIEFNEAIRKEPSNADAFFNLGNAFYDLEDYENAVTVYKESTILRPRFVDAYNNLGHSLFILRKDNEAIKAYHDAIKINPNDPYGYFFLGNVYYASKDYKNAIKYYSEVIKQNPNYIEAHLNLAHSYFNTTEFDLAMMKYYDTLNLEPDNQDAQKGLILTQKRMKLGGK